MVRSCFDLLYGFVYLIPYPLYRGLSWVISLILYGASKRLRRNAIESLSIAYGEAMPLKEKQRIARVSFFALSLGLADLLFYIARPGRACDVFTVEGIEHLKAAKEAGKGAVIAVAHFGPFAAMLFKFIYEGYPVRVLMRAPRGKALRQDLVSRRERFAPQPIYSTPLRECVVSCFTTLKNNEVLVMPLDQNYGGPGRVFVDFFGRKAATAAGPAAYAVKTGAAFLSAFAVPVRDGRWRIVVEPLPIDRLLPENEAVRKATQDVTARIEVMIRQYPDQWSWMHRRWKAVPKEGELV